MGEEGYSGISLPTELVKQIEKIVNNKKYGYASNTEFIKEALRIYMREHFENNKKTH
jgi:metal-responsive CopG/Arc/MetJ family transcriptional regulator